MNKKCMITAKSTNITLNDIDVYYIEDYIGFGNVKEARICTDKIFMSNRSFIERYDYDGYKVSWAWYDQIYQISLKYTEIKNLIHKLEYMNYDSMTIEGIHPSYEKVLIHYFFDKNLKTNKKTNVKSNIKFFTINIVLLFFSIISIVYFFIRNKKNVGIRTEDLIFKGTKSDFRLNHLYSELDNNKINYIEFIRSRNFKSSIINIFIRKKFAIYYDCIAYFVKLFSKNRVYEIKPTNFQESVLFRCSNNNEVLISTLKYIRIIYKLCHIDKMIITSFSSRSASLCVAAKSLGITNIGIMHGLSIKDYAVQEFMESYSENKNIGPDVFGVWSDHWVKYFQKYCKNIGIQNIYHSGLLRPLNNFNRNEFSKVPSDKIRVLLISEPLVSAEEILPYIKKIIECDEFEIGIKVRPMIKDKFYEQLKDLYPEIEAIPKYDGKILEDGKNFDIFIGSNSTALLEASLIGKISIAVQTNKWGDYFSFDELIHETNLLVCNSNEICENIKYRFQNEHDLKTIKLIKNKFFGEGKDGTHWIIQEIRKD